MLIITKTRASRCFSNQFSLLVGEKKVPPLLAWRAAPSLPPPRLCLSVTDSYLSLSIINPPPLGPTPRAGARWALNWCSVQRYQMARQMTSPWPHYTRTQRRGGVLTEWRAEATRATPQRANPGNSQVKRVLETLAFLYIPVDEWITSRNIHSFLFSPTHPPNIDCPYLS